MNGCGALILTSGLLIVAIAAVAGCQASRALPAQTSTMFAFPDEPFPVRRINLHRFSPEFRATQVSNPTDLEPGTILIDTSAKHLYFIESADTAMRYGIAVGAAGHSWKGAATVGRKAVWPAWYPTDEMKQIAPGIPARIPPGADNPLGARALYLYQDGHDTLYRIHGTTEPWTIGTEASSGCIRMFNEDVIALYAKVPVGAKVVVR